MEFWNEKCVGTLDHCSICSNADYLENYDYQLLIMVLWRHKNNVLILVSIKDINFSCIRLYINWYSCSSFFQLIYEKCLNKALYVFLTVLALQARKKRTKTKKPNKKWVNSSVVIVRYEVVKGGLNMIRKHQWLGSAIIVETVIIMCSMLREFISGKLHLYGALLKG